MARINLLPWREELRKQRQQQFMALLGLAVIVTGALMAGVHFYVENRMDFQRERNAYLQREIQQLDEQIKEINALDKTRQRLEARMNIIQQLQTSRPEIVHLFDELARTLPEGIYLTSVQESNSSINIKGTAQSNARVSTYMWNLEKSEWLADPNLQVIETAQKDGGRASQFVLNANQSRPKPADEKGGSQ